MSIQFSHGKKKVVCDECDSDMSDWYPVSSFSDMIEEAKENGKIEQVAPGQWEHTCDDCGTGAGLRAAKSLFGL